MGETINSVPTYRDILWPTLLALKTAGGSASNDELSELVAGIMKLSDDVLDIPHTSGSMSAVDYRAAWSRTHLKMIGAIDNSERGVWSLTEFGRTLESDEQVRALVKEARAARSKKQRATGAPETNDNDDAAAVLTDDDWQDSLLSILREMDPSAFERLCQRILREAGFTKVEVTGRVGDGGIDGAGVLRVNLLSFHVRFQCKRYAGSVSSSEIRDFRGAMVGRADKGLFMTTGRFTRDAEREAVRDGAPAIDLIDGLELCLLLKKYGLGVRTETKETISIEHEFYGLL